MTQKEAIELLIDDYERRLKSAEILLQQELTVGDWGLVAGKHEAYRLLLHELKQVLNLPKVIDSTEQA